MAVWVRAGLVAALLTAAGLPTMPAMAQQPATAAPLPPVDPGLHAYLSQTPVTLLEWGMLRLGRDVQAAVTALSLEGGRGGAVKAGTLFRPFDRRVLAYISLPVSGKGRSLDQCQEIYALVRDHLLAGAPSGLSGPPWYLQRLFGADTRGSSGRPEPFGEMLVDMVLLEVTLRRPEAEAFTAGPANIVCAGRLDQEQAVIVPPWKPPA